MGRTCSHKAIMEDGTSALKILTDKHIGKSPLGRPRRKLGDNNRIDLKEIGINTRTWVGSAQDRDYWRAHVNAELNLLVPQAL